MVYWEYWLLGSYCGKVQINKTYFAESYLGKFCSSFYVSFEDFDPRNVCSNPRRCLFHHQLFIANKIALERLNWDAQLPPESTICLLKLFKQCIKHLKLIILVSMTLKYVKTLFKPEYF